MRLPCREGLLQDGQFGRVNPGKAPFFLENSAANTHLLAGESVFVDGGVQLVRFFDDYHFAVRKVYGQAQFVGILDGRNAVLAAGTTGLAGNGDYLADRTRVVLR